MTAWRRQVESSGNHNHFRIGRLQGPGVIANLNTLSAFRLTSRLSGNASMPRVVNQLKTASNLAILSTLNNWVYPVEGVLQGPVPRRCFWWNRRKSVGQTDVPLIGAFTSAGFPLIGSEAAKPRTLYSLPTARTVYPPLITSIPFQGRSLW